jgi:SAM-dependent methyltransferase
MSAASLVRTERDYYLEIYDFLHEFLVEDIKFYLSQLCPGRDSVLELGCGTGRVLRPLLQAGIDVSGLDISEGMLEIAARSVPPSCELIHADMRDYSLDRLFSGVIIPFNTFLYMYSADDRQACLGCAFRHLQAGGFLLVDVFNPEYILRTRQQGVLHHEMTKFRPDTQAIFSYFSSYVSANGLLYWHQFFEEIDPVNACAKHYRMMKLKNLPESELRDSCEAAGFTVEKVLGWYDGRTASAASNNLIALLRKPGRSHA